eukprot:CAMPEP_0195651106 /NCGR_PEP_ID=MMETSP0815-20121206/32069_1 /TAXON_ID=97485 /ORGANISM="Prymnesium parvum, Strain Texoma1" /LENGTH=48 /DNA_ID= /DNA_START= /DNA_END= /DNA_ORIENTATION=
MCEQRAPSLAVNASVISDAVWDARESCRARCDGLRMAGSPLPSHARWT